MKNNNYYEMFLSKLTDEERRHPFAVNIIKQIETNDTYLEGDYNRFINEKSDTTFDKKSYDEHAFYWFCHHILYYSTLCFAAGYVDKNYTREQASRVIDSVKDAPKKIIEKLKRIDLYNKLNSTGVKNERLDFINNLVDHFNENKYDMKHTFAWSMVDYMTPYDKKENIRNKIEPSIKIRKVGYITESSPNLYDYLNAKLSLFDMYGNYIMDCVSFCKLTITLPWVIKDVFLNGNKKKDTFYVHKDNDEYIGNVVMEKVDTFKWEKMNEDLEKEKKHNEYMENIDKKSRIKWYLYPLIILGGIIVIFSGGSMDDFGKK